MTKPIQTSIEPVTAWRLWRLVRDVEGRLRLGPVGYGVGDWPPRDAFRARCRAGGGSPGNPRKLGRHRSPSMTCSCGIYASANLEELLQPGGTPLIGVIGTVSMWGRVIEHEHGWRAEYAYPQRLRLVCIACLDQGGDGIEAAAVFRDLDPQGGVIGLCARHRFAIFGLRAVGEGADEVLAELLDTYAVDLLPTEALEPIRVPRNRDLRTPWQRRVEELRRPFAPVLDLPPVVRAPSAPAPVARPRKDPLLRRVGRGIGVVLFWSFAVMCYLQGSMFTVSAPPPTAEPAIRVPVVAPVPSFVLPEVEVPGPVEGLDPAPQPDLPG